MYFSSPLNGFFLSIRYLIIGILVCGIIPLNLLAGDVAVTITFQSNEKYNFNEVGDFVVQGPYDGDKWMVCDNDYDTIICSKKFNGAGRGIYIIKGSLSAIWKNSGRGARTKVPYTIEVISTNNENDLVKTGFITSGSGLHMSKLTSFTIKEQNNRSYRENRKIHSNDNDHFIAKGKCSGKDKIFKNKYVCGDGRILKINVKPDGSWSISDNRYQFGGGGGGRSAAERAAKKICHP